MSKRAERRHQRKVKLARRYRILRDRSDWYRGKGAGDLTPRCMHAHINCGCMGQKDGPLARDVRRAAAESPSKESR